jgi:hypothetical protein
MQPLIAVVSAISEVSGPPSHTLHLPLPLYFSSLLFRKGAAVQIAMGIWGVGGGGGAGIGDH